jgi:hypothetical protein
MAVSRQCGMAPKRVLKQVVTMTEKEGEPLSHKIDHRKGPVLARGSRDEEAIKSPRQNFLSSQFQAYLASNPRVERSHDLLLSPEESVDDDESSSVEPPGRGLLGPSDLPPGPPGPL